MTEQDRMAMVPGPRLSPVSLADLAAGAGHDGNVPGYVPRARRDVPHETCHAVTSAGPPALSPGFMPGTGLAERGDLSSAG
jgi:hypothetical protein